MARYRIVKVPIQGKPDKYRVEVQKVKLLPWWSTTRSILVWYRLDEWGRIWHNRQRGPSPSQLGLFDSEPSAKEYIKQCIEYINKPEEVVFDTDNPEKN